MRDCDIKELFEKQLQLLSERSKGCATDQDLVALTSVMVQIGYFLYDRFPKDVFGDSDGFIQKVVTPSESIREIVRSTIDDTERETPL